MLHVSTYYQINAINVARDPKTGEALHFPDNITPMAAFDYYPDALSFFDKMKKHPSPGTRLELIQYTPQPVQAIEL